MGAVRPLLMLAVAVLALAWTAPARADAFADAVAGLAARDFGAKQEAVSRLAELGHPRAVAVLNAMLDNSLYTRDSDRRVVIGAGSGSQVAITDAATGEALGMAGSRDLSRITINNRLRIVLRAAISRLEIANADPEARLAAAQAIARDRSPEATALLQEALAREAVPRVQEAMRFSLAQMQLVSPDRAERLAAIEELSHSVSQEVRGQLSQLVRTNPDGSFAEPDAGVRAAAQTALDRIESRRAWIDAGVNLFQGISLGSVLLLAAIGLAITFGVMGVINMAHGEMIMLGAYVTFTVQEIFRAVLPGAVDAYVLVAIPAAFVVTALVGMALEQGIIRFLYGRPLETLLATWGISLILQQAIRLTFGAPNREVANPSWMTGSFEPISGAVLTWNRMYIILFAALVLAGTALILRYTQFGLQMRAVTQNRGMARAMGIRSGWIDAMTFGLGSGIAGVAGVALSQIGNVSPNLGQSYIVDSFIVVVFGGVGSLWGVLVASLGLGVVNKLLEPFAGAVLGKIVVLVLIILFIQKRPRGMFALKGRAAEA